MAPHDWIPSCQTGTSAVAPGPGPELEWDDFNRRFRIRTDDPRYGYAMLHSRLMVRLMQPNADPWWIENGWILIAGPWPQSPDELDRRVDQLTEMMGLIPDFVWRDYGHVDPALLPGRTTDRSDGPERDGEQEAG